MSDNQPKPDKLGRIHPAQFKPGNEHAFKPGNPHVFKAGAEHPRWTGPPQSKRCKQCGEKFTLRRGTNKFCSRECYLRWRKASQRPVEQRECIQCGDEFTTFVSARRIHCSKPCAVLTANTKRVASFARPPQSYRSESSRMIGMAVAEARVSRKLTQPQLAEMAGLSVATVHAIESGKKGDSPPTMRSLESVLEVLGLRLGIVGEQEGLRNNTA